jgi:hypothetical protein
MLSNRRKKAVKIEAIGKIEEINETKNSDYLNLLLVAWFLESCALGPNLISQFILPPVIRVLFSVTSVLVLISLPSRLKIKKQVSPYNLIIVAGLLTYNLGLIVSFNDITTLDVLINRLLISVTLIVSYICMEEDIFVRCMDAYCKLMTFFAVSAIIVSAIVLIFHLPPTNEFTAPEGRVYQNYAIAFVEAEVDTLSGFKRAGSFYDEPGTFAVFLIPAILWTMLVRPSTVIFLSLFTALILTFSVGGWMSFAISLVYVITLYPDVIKKYRVTIISAFFVIGVVTCINTLVTFVDVSWLSAYFDYKFTGEGSVSTVSSVDIRQNEIESFFATLAENPAGYGIKSKKIPFFSIGLFGSSIEAGLLGVVGYGITIFGMIAILLENLILIKRKQSRAVVSILGSNLSMLIMSTQRIDSLAFYTGIFMLSFMMNCAVVTQPQALNAAIEAEAENVIPEDEKFTDSALVTALKGSKVVQTVSKLFNASKKSRAVKNISKLFIASKESQVVKTVSKLFNASKDSQTVKTISKLFNASKDSKVVTAISKIFTPPKQAKSTKSSRAKPGKLSVSSDDPQGKEQLKKSLDDLFKSDKK